MSDAEPDDADPHGLGKLAQEVNALQGRVGALRDRVCGDECPVSRVVVVDHSPTGQGRVFDKWELTNVTTSLQDDGRTLKVFVR